MGNHNPLLTNAFSELSIVISIPAWRQSMMKLQYNELENGIRLIKLTG